MPNGELKEWTNHDKIHNGALAATWHSVIDSDSKTEDPGFKSLQRAMFF
jgi:hypothetical protein